jgi:hypothetical protein
LHFYTNIVSRIDFNIFIDDLERPLPLVGGGFGLKRFPSFPFQNVAGKSKFVFSLKPNNEIS